MEADAAYYGARAAALAKESLEEVARTDFTRMRRGRLYFRDGTDPHSGRLLHVRLTEAFQKKDSAAILQVTAEILAHDQADIRAHMLRAHTLLATNDPHAAFHRAVAKGLFDSIMSSGDGRGTKTAWTVYRTKEEYEVLKVLGYVPRGQALVSEGGKVFDRLDARKFDGGETVQVFFEITEMFATEGPQPNGGQ